MRIHVEIDIDVGDRVAGVLRTVGGWIGRRRQPPKRGWGVFVWDEASEVHVVPLCDEIEHEMPGDACICGPSGDLVICLEHGDTWRYTHNSLDGRERSGPVEAPADPG